MSFFRRYRRWLVLVLVTVSVFIPALHPVHAAPVDAAAGVVGQILFWWLQGVAWLVSQLINLLIVFIQFNTFYDHPIVTTGWDIVIQIANMMFLVALLVIAAGTVLNLQNYRYSKLLGQVVLMALLVNFSKLIAGFFIQLSQVVMLTFVNSFKDALFGNMATMFGLDKVFAFSGQPVSQEIGSLVPTLVVSMAFMVIAGMVIAAFLGIIIYRIVALWVLLIMSPLAYGLAILPQTKKYADQWWSEFTEQLTRGPVIAFFLWLALAVVAQYPVDNPTQGWLPDQQAQIKALNNDTSALNGFINDYLEPGNVISFLVAIVFLMTGLKQATSASGAAGTWAKNLSGAAGKAGAFVSGLDYVRQRTLQPVQGYLKRREQRTQEAVSRRTDNLTLAANRVEGATVGVASRAIQGTKSAIGSVPRGALQQGRRILRTTGEAFTQAQAEGRSLAGSVGAAAAGGAKEATLGTATQIGRGAINLPGAAIAGARLGTVEDQLRQKENQDIRRKQQEFTSTIGGYAQMGSAMRDEIGLHGSDDERFAANLESAKRKELDVENNPEHRQRAEELGSQLIGRAANGEEMAKYMQGIEPVIASAILHGAGNNLLLRTVQGGKRDILAYAGGIKEAYQGDEASAKKFIERNASKVADMVKNRLISSDTLGSKELVKAISKLEKVDEDSILELTKDKHLGDAFSKTMHTVVEEVNTRPNNTFGVGGATEEERKENKANDKLRTLYAMSKKGGTIKINQDGADREFNTLDYAFGNLATPDAQEAAGRLIRTDGKSLSKFEYEFDNGAKKVSEELAKAFVNNINVGALSATFEKNAETVKETLNRMRALGDKPVAGLDQTQLDERKAARQKVKRANSNDILTGLVPPLQSEEGENKNAGGRRQSRGRRRQAGFTAQWPDDQE